MSDEKFREAYLKALRMCCDKGLPLRINTDMLNKGVVGIGWENSTDVIGGIFAGSTENATSMAGMLQAMLDYTTGQIVCPVCDGEGYECGMRCWQCDATGVHESK